MKRGNALIIAIVLLLAVSIFSTGNYVPFANNLSGGAYSIVGNAIVTITGNQVAEGEDSPRIIAEHCTENRDCLSNICRTTGNNRQCIDTIPAEGEAKRGTGRTCSKDSHCTSGKCSNSICGLPRGNSCTIRNKRYCLSNDCFSGECDYSNPTNTPGNNAGDLCSKSNDDCISSPIKYSCVNHRCKKHSDLKSKGAACTEDSQCLSGDCTTQNKCATSSSDEACKQNSDCATNYICSQKKCISKITTPGIVTTGPKKSNGVSCTSDNQCSSSFCDPATNKCAPLVAVGGEDTRNAKLNRLKKAIESALNLLKTRLNPLEINHRSQIAQVTGAFTVIELGGGINRDPETVSEWKTSLANLSALMQGVEDRICEESFKHPEAETEGLPCSLSSRPGLPSLPKPKSASLPKVILPTKISIPRPGGEFQ